MRITGSANVAPWDRTSLNNGADVDVGTVAPHGATTRATYTVPTGKYAIVHTIFAKAVRVTAAAPVGLWGMQFGWPSPTGPVSRSLKNAIGDENQIQADPQAILKGGNAVTFVTFDASTGGTVNYYGTIVVTQFQP